MSNLFRKYGKLLSILATRDPLWLRGLRHGVAAGVEHAPVLKRLSCQTIVDVGANRGQFALAARRAFPDAAIHSFEPLPEPATVFGRVFEHDPGTTLHRFAIGPDADQHVMHVSARDDSSSLLPISSLQEQLFPGTGEVETVTVQVVTLDAVLAEGDIAKPALLKLDVQGFELEALRGCEQVIAQFDWVYCECSFVELYSGQKLAADVIDWLSGKGIRLVALYNPSYDSEGQAVQADFMFQRMT